jgi:hypothetical protein
VENGNSERTRRTSPHFWIHIVSITKANQDDTTSLWKTENPPCSAAEIGKTIWRESWNQSQKRGDK